jgi:hypothetical protein
MKGWAAEQEIQPLPPDGTAYGMRLSDWATAYVQWFVSIPVSASPTLGRDATGERAGVGQRTPVWFLPPYLIGSSGSRTFTIPDGQAVLVAPAFALNGDAPGVAAEAELLDPDPTSYLEQISLLEVSLDGAKVSDIQPHRVKTPLFTIALTSENILDFPVTDGKDGRLAAAAEGYWFLYPPLPPGNHVLTIRQEGRNPFNNNQAYQTEWTFNLVVRKPNEPLE